MITSSASSKQIAPESFLRSYAIRIMKIICNKRIQVPLALRGSGLCKELLCFITWLQMSGTREERDFGERDRQGERETIINVNDLEVQQNAANFRLRSFPTAFQSKRVAHLKSTEVLFKVAVPLQGALWLNRTPKPDYAASSKSLRLAYFNDFCFPLLKTSIQSHYVKQAVNLAG